MALRIILLFVFSFESFSILISNPEHDSLILRLELTQDDIKKCDLLNNIASIYLRMDQAKAISYAEKAYHLSLRLNYEEGLTNSNFIQGKAYQNLNKYEEALDKYLSSLVIQRHLKNENIIAEINHRLGRICKTTGNYEKALEYCLNALRIREKQENFLSIANIYNTMGSIYKYIGDYNQALDYYSKCMEIQKKYRKQGITGWIYNNIGIVYNLLKRHDKALCFYDKGLIIRTANSDSLGIAASYNNIGGVYLDMGKLDSANYYLRKSLTIKEKFGDEKSLVNVYYNIGDTYFRNKNYSKALGFVNKSLFIADKLKLSQSILNCCKLLKEIYQEKGDFKKALNYQTIYEKVNDSIFNIEKSMRMAQLAMLYENELIQFEHDLKDQKRLFINIAIFVTMFFLLIILFFTYSNLKSKFKHNKLKRVNLEMEKDKLAVEIDNKNREIISNTIHLSEKNELILDLKKTLQKLKANIKDENKAKIQSIINDMNASHTNKIWEEFEIRFTNVHKGFYDKLFKEHIELTKNEKRLASFLRLNMTSKEISMITKQSVHSIEVARTRLRKKLGLSNTDINLDSYLAKY